MNFKKRIDQLLVERKLVESREKGRAMIMAGNVLVDDQPVLKAGALVSELSEIRLRNAPDPYVSRAAHKLIHGLQFFNLSVQGLIGLDVGSSTGGFTQVLLEKGALRVFAVDVGTNQLHYKLRSDPRVVSMEKKNARFMTPEWFDEQPQIGVTDVSFISLELILPAMEKVLPNDAFVLSLFKPQFEVGPEHLDQGIVRDQTIALEKLSQLIAKMKSQNLVAIGQTESPLKGADGNIEYLVLWKVERPV